MGYNAFNGMGLHTNPAMSAVTDGIQYGSPQAFGGQISQSQPFQNQGVSAFNGGTTLGYYGDMNIQNTQPMAFGAQEQGGFGMPSLSQFGAGAGIAKDLYGMYMANQGLDMAKKNFGEMKRVNQFNMDNKNAFLGSARKAFG